MIVLHFSAQADLGSELIRWFSHGAYSHVDSALPDGRLVGARSDVCLGIPAGVQVRPPGYAGFSRVLRIDLPADDNVTNAYYRLLAAEIGKPYDMRAIAGFASGRDWREGGAWFCSELSTAMLERSGWFPFPLATPANKMDPDDELLAVSARVGLIV
jgi:hypothetical protein